MPGEESVTPAGAPATPDSTHGTGSAVPPVTDEAARRLAGFQSQLAKKGWTDPSAIPDLGTITTLNEAARAKTTLEQQLATQQAEHAKAMADLSAAQKQVTEAQVFRAVFGTIAADASLQHLMPLVEEIAALAQPGKEAETIQRFASKLPAGMLNPAAAAKQTPGAQPTPSSAPPAGGTVDLEAAVAAAEQEWYELSQKGTPDQMRAAQEKYLNLWAQYQKSSNKPDPYGYNPRPDGW